MCFSSSLLIRSSYAVWSASTRSTRASQRKAREEKRGEREGGTNDVCPKNTQENEKFIKAAAGARTTYRVVIPWWGIKVWVVYAVKKQWGKGNFGSVPEYNEREVCSG